MSEAWIAGVTGAEGSMIVRADDVGTAAAGLAAALGGEVVEGIEAFDEAVALRRDQLAERVAAHTAVALLAREQAAPRPEPRVLTDTAGLRTLVGKIETAVALIDGTHSDARASAGAASGLAVHPSSIRDAAADVVAARAHLAACERTLAEATETSEATDSTDATDVAAAEPEADEDAVAADETPGPRPDRWRITDREEIGRAALYAAAATAIGILVLLVTGSPLALIFPGVAVCWIVVLVVRQRDDAYDEEIASRNLAKMSSFTERAYGGAGLDVDDDTDFAALEAARRAVAEASDRLAYAEASWRSLVGPDADVDDVESVVQSRDAQYGVSNAVVAELPSVRTAEAHARRLHAQWKLAFWALDRPVPSGEEAAAAIAGLEAEGISEITVSPHVSGGLSAAEQDRLSELAAGRDEDTLRAVAERSLPPVVVVDADGEIDEERLADATRNLPADVRFVVVAPAG